MTHHRAYSYDNTTPSSTNTSLNPNTNNATTPSPINPSLNPNNTNSTTTTLVENTTANNNVVRSGIITSNVIENTTTNNNVVRREMIASDAPINPFLNPNYTYSTTAATAVVEYTTTSNNVGSNNNTNLRQHSEFPPGYRFCPTDRELIFHYLQRRVMNLQLPHDKMKDVPFYDSTPDELSEQYEPVGEKEWYFFTSRDRKYKNGQRPNRATGKTLGYWKAAGKEKPIHHPHNQGETIGRKRSLAFHRGKSRNQDGSKSDWIMHEFTLEKTPKRKRLHDNDMQLDWVLSKIYKHKNNKCPKDNEKLEIDNEANPQPESKEVANTKEAECEKLPLLPNMEYTNVWSQEELEILNTALYPNTNEHGNIVNNGPEPGGFLPDNSNTGIDQTMYNYSHCNDFQQSVYNPETNPVMPSGYNQGEPSGEKGFHNPETNSGMNYPEYYQGEPSGQQGFYNPATRSGMNLPGYIQGEPSGEKGFQNPNTESAMNLPGYYQEDLPGGEMDLYYPSGEQGFLNPKTESEMNLPGYYQEELPGEMDPYYQEQRPIMNPPECLQIEPSSGEYNVTQLTSMLNLDNVELHNNLIALPNNPQTNAPSSDQQD